MSNLSKIINVKYPGQAADLIDGVPVGPVQGYHINNDSDNQNWQFINAGGNTFKFQNGTTQTYARVNGLHPGKDVVGGAEEEWKLIPLSDPSAYKIATINEQYIWSLTGPNDFAPIVLVPFSYDGPEALWTYRPAY